LGDDAEDGLETLPTACALITAPLPSAIQESSLAIDLAGVLLP